MQNPGPASLKIDCSYCPVRHRAVCSRCEEDELARLNSMKSYRSYAAGDTVAMQGEATSYVASVVAGVATLNQTVEDGRTQVVGLLLPSDFLGRPGRETVAHHVVAASDLTLCSFERRPFETLLTELPHLRERLFEMVLDELDAARDWMFLLGRKTAREKVASFLSVIAQRSVPHDLSELEEPINVALPLTREAMANFLGLTIETVSRQLTALRKDGVITLDGARMATVLDIGALQAEAAVPAA